MGFALKTYAKHSGWGGGHGINMKKSNTVKIVIIGIVLAVIVVGYYYHISNIKKGDTEEVVESSAVQAVLMRDLDKNYPPTPKEVVKYFNEISKCFYNENYTEDELDDLAVKIQGVYDDELIANKTKEQYMKDLKSDIDEMEAMDRTLSSYELSASTDVEEFVEDGNTCARLYCNYNIRQGTKMLSSRVVFILRKDENSHWKILGWDLDD